MVERLLVSKVSHSLPFGFPGSEGSSASAEEGNTFSGAGKIQVTGRQLTLSQIIALLIKRFHHVRRSKKGFICEVRGICF